MPKGSLIVVGSGIQVYTQITAETEKDIRVAAKLFYLLPPPWAKNWMISLNSTAESLGPYDEIENNQIQAQMVEKIVRAVRSGLRVCVVLYGHPSIGHGVGWQAINLARDEGFAAHMVAAVSAEDCLFAELGIDPAVAGYQSFDAVRFLLRKRQFDPQSNLVLTHLGQITQLGTIEVVQKALVMLTQRLSDVYGIRYQATVYDASPLPDDPSRMRSLSLQDLPEVDLRPTSMLFVASLEEAPIDSDILNTLGLGAGQEGPPTLAPLPPVSTNSPPPQMDQST